MTRVYKTRKDYTGKRFGDLLVTGRDCSSQKENYWLFICDCGVTGSIFTGWLKRKGSCGCKPLPDLPTNKFHTGRSKTLTYKKWRKMMERCYNQKDISYPNYGGRGIDVFQPWHTSYNFFVDMGECPPGYSLERINNDKGYYPDNCVWVLRAAQNRNKRTSVKLTYQGKTQTIAEWAREIGVLDKTLYFRYSAGWPVELILSTQNLSTGEDLCRF